MLKFTILITSFLFAILNSLGQQKNTEKPALTVTDTLCKEGYMTNTIVTSGFDYSEIDTIKIKEFIKNGRFDQPIDSFLVMTKYIRLAGLSSIHDSVLKQSRIYITKKISSNVDFEIIISDTLVYRVSNMQIRQLHYRDWDACIVSSYDLNGYTHDGDILIDKPGFENDLNEKLELIHRLYLEELDRLKQENARERELKKHEAFLPCHITTIGFDFNAVDTIQVKKIANGDSSKVVLDSFYFYQDRDILQDSILKKRSVSFCYQADITSGFEYQIILHDGTVFTISNIEKRWMRLRDEYATSQYLLNGLPTSGNIVLKKNGY